MPWRDFSIPPSCRKSFRTASLRTARRTLPDLLLGAELGQKVLSSQSFEIHNEVESGHQVALEVTWAGTLKVPVQSLPVGAKMRARFAVFLEFRDGRIVTQRNYDCFDPW